MLIRRERDRDVAAVRSIVSEAFARGTDSTPPVEVGLLDALRCDGWQPRLCLVAVDPATDEVLGQVTVTRGHVDSVPALGLGPIAVRPDRQRAGVGSALMHGVVAAAGARDETTIALLGEPHFYRRFGFRAASDVGIRAPDPAWGHSFQVLPLTVDHPRGAFSYAAPFGELIRGG